MGEYRYEILGMSCEGCVGSVTRILKQAEPRAGVAVTLEPAQAVLTCDQPPALETLRLALANAGFTLAGEIRP